MVDNGSVNELSDYERAVYAWQMSVPGVGEAGQRKLKSATVLISRVGGVGGVAAQELAAAGVGRLILAHAGLLKPSDLNRQTLMHQGALGRSRVETAAARLRQFNPHLEVVAIPENVSPANASRLVAQADVVIDAAPLFEERFALNQAVVEHRRPMVEAAMYELTLQVTTVVPGQTACLACRVPEIPRDWTRQFPVFGAAAGTTGCLAAMEAIKLITGIGTPLCNRLLVADLRDVTFRLFHLRRNPACPVCSSLPGLATH